MPRLRLGVALLLPAPVAHEVDGLRRALGDANRTRVAPHITLVPPVNVRQEHLGTALAVLRAAAAAAPRELTVTLGPPASFLPANAVLYLPVAGDLPALVKLRERVWAPPLTRTLTWPFVAHVTLADEAPAERIAAAVAAMADYQVTATFDRVHLLVERRPEGGAGPQWVPLADVGFGPPAIVARGGPLAVELTRSCLIDPEAQALLAGTAAGALAAGALAAGALAAGSLASGAPAGSLAAGSLASGAPAGSLAAGALAADALAAGSLLADDSRGHRRHRPAGGRRGRCRPGLARRGRVPGGGRGCPRTPQPGHRPPYRGGPRGGRGRCRLGLPFSPDLDRGPGGLVETDGGVDAQLLQPVMGVDAPDGARLGTHHQ